MILLNMSRPTCPLSAAGLRNVHRHRVSLACAAKRGSQRPAQQPASLSKKAEELMQVAVNEAAQQSAAASQKTVAELRHIHSGVDKLLDEAYTLTDIARVQRLQMARLVLGPHLESSGSYGSYKRFEHPRLMDRILEAMLCSSHQSILLRITLKTDLNHETYNFKPNTLRYELDGLTGLTSEVFQGDDGNWYVQFKDDE